MTTRRLIPALCAAALFVWGCGGDHSTGPDNTKKSTPWTNAGGDFAAVPSATARVADVGGYRWGSTPAMVADVEAWIASPETDFGWLLEGDESTVSAKRFDTREHSIAANRPRLRVYHDGGATPTSIPPVKDNTLVESAASNLSNGKGEHMFAGRTAESSHSRRRAVFAFGVADSIASTAKIDSVVLELHMSRTGNHPQAFTVTLHRLAADWGEGASYAGPGGEQGAGAPAASGDATWLYRFFEP